MADNRIVDMADNRIKLKEREITTKTLQEN